MSSANTMHSYSNVPNIPEADVPVGDDDAHNIVVKTVGSPPDLSFDPKPHWELGEVSSTSSTSGGRSSCRGRGSTSSRARAQRCSVPSLPGSSILTSTSSECWNSTFLTWSHGKLQRAAASFPKFADTMYHDEEDDLWMIPTAEVPITNIHADEIHRSWHPPPEVRGALALLSTRKGRCGPRHPWNQASPPV